MIIIIHDSPLNIILPILSRPIYRSCSIILISIRRERTILRNFFNCNRVRGGAFARNIRLASTYFHESSARFVHRYAGALRVHPVTRGSDRRDYCTATSHRHHSGRAEDEERAARPETGRSAVEEGHRTERRGSVRRGRQKSGRSADQQR